MRVLLVFLLTVISFPSAAMDRCDSLYTAAQSARAAVSEGLNEVRLEPEAQREWRETNRRLLRATERVRTCYNPLLPSSEARDPAPANESQEATLPAPTSLARERVIKMYDWAVLAHRELRAYDAAFQQYDAFFQRFGASADSSQIALMYNKRGYLHYKLGNLTASISDYTRTIDHTPVADTLDRADLMIDLGTILQKIDDLDAAQEYYVRAEQLADATSASRRRQAIRARALFNRGDVLLNWPSDDDSTRAVRRQRSIDLLHQAIDAYPAGWTDRVARTHIILANAYRRVGDLEAAFRHLERGRTLVEQHALDDSRVSVLALAALVRGMTEFDAGRLDAATATLTEGLRVAKLGNNLHGRYRIMQELGELHAYRGHPARAESYYRQAITVTNKLRASLRATEWASYASDDWSAPYRGLVRVLAAQDRLEEAFLVLDRSRARHLRDKQMQTRLTNVLPPRDRVRFDSLTTALATVRNTLATEDLPTDRRTVLEQDEVRLMAARRTLLNLESAAALSSITMLQQHLQAERRALVAYFIDDTNLGEDGAPSSFAFVVTPQAFRSVPLRVDDDSLRIHIGAVSSLLRDGGAFNLDAVDFDLTALHRLYVDVFAPVAEALPDSIPLTIIPDGPLFRVPFGMLVTQPPKNAAYHRAPYLIRERPLSMELSAALINDTTRTRDRFSFDIAALGRTQFKTVPALPPVLRSRLDATGGLPALPGVERELDALRDRFAHRQILLNEQATEDRLHSVLPHTKILHLASHALVHPADPFANLFVLTPSESSDAQDGRVRDDGLLFMHELGTRHASVPLVVLSGCGTARGIMRTGEGPRGLQYAFRSTGARSTLSTLWEAEDQVAVALTSSFYDHLLAGRPKDVALQQAQLEILERYPHRASPFFWAGAVLYGTPKPLSLAPAPAIPLLPVAAGGALLLLVALGFGYARYRRH
jgi:CHAT domain-containing protein